MLGRPGAEVELMEPHPELPDLVFTANAGLVNGRQFVPARFRHPERQARDAARDARGSRSRASRSTSCPTTSCHEGAGDALPFGGVLVSGYRIRSDAAAHADLSRLTGAAGALGRAGRRAAVPPRPHVLPARRPPRDRGPDGLGSLRPRVIEALVPEPLVLDDDEALSFCANSVVVGTTVVMPICPPASAASSRPGASTWSCAPVDEFLKAGGGCRCLTLALDVEL